MTAAVLARYRKRVAAVFELTLVSGPSPLGEARALLLAIDPLCEWGFSGTGIPVIHVQPSKNIPAH